MQAYSPRRCFPLGLGSYEEGTQALTSITTTTRTATHSEERVHTRLRYASVVTSSTAYTSLFRLNIVGRAFIFPQSVAG